MSDFLCVVICVNLCTIPFKSLGWYYLFIYFQRNEYFCSEKIWSNSPNSAANKHVKMISDGSCDTEDCSNDPENPDTFHHRNKNVKYI